MEHTALLLPVCLVLTACVASGPGGDHDIASRMGQGFNDAMKAHHRFSCENGLAIEVDSLDTESVALRLDDQRAVLHIALSGSGERYVADQGVFGNATAWHHENGEGVFEFVDPYGNKVETICQQW